MKLRFAEPEDAQALLDVYARYIHTPITFEYDLPSREEFARRIASTLERYPYLVAEEAGKAVGYAYAHQMRERAAYQWDAELSIYLRPEDAGQGLGKKLYTGVMELARLQGVRTVYGLVTRPNPASEGLHRSLGFEQTYVQRSAGHKNGSWLDLIWFEKVLNPFTPEPQPIIPVGQLPAGEVRRVLEAL